MGCDYFLQHVRFFVCFLIIPANSVRNLPGFLTKVRRARVETFNRNFVPVAGSITVRLLTFGSKVLFVCLLEWDMLYPVDFFLPVS